MTDDTAYFRSEEFKEILQQYEDSVRAGHPPYMDADTLADIADYYHYMGDDFQADDVIDYALTLHPNATLPNVFKARKALTTGDVDAACEFVERIESKDDPEYHYMQAELLMAQDRVEEADKYLRQYFRTVAPEEYQDFVMDVANIYYDYGLNDKAYEWMMRSKGDDSNDFKELMARTLFGIGKYQDSERLYNELLDKDPYSKEYWNELAHAQFMNDDFSGAITSSEYAIAIDPEDPEGVITKANGLYRLGNYEEAIRYYDRYGEISSPDEFSLLHKGSCLVYLNRLEEAILVFQQAIAVSPHDSTILPQIHQELAFCYSKAHRLEEALHCIDETKDLDCDHIDMIVLKGHILLENGHKKEAEESFKQAIILSHNDPDILLRIIVSLHDNKYVKTSYSMFKRFFDTVVDDTYNNGYSYMALCCWDLGYAEEFLDYLRMAVERNPKEARAVLGHLFPEDMEVEAYYQYITQNLKK